MLVQMLGQKWVNKWVRRLVQKLVQTWVLKNEIKQCIFRQKKCEALDILKTYNKNNKLQIED